MKALALSLGIALPIAGVLLIACAEEARDPRADIDDGADAATTDDGAAPDADATVDAEVPPTVTCATDRCFTRLVAGPTHYCAVAKAGTVHCWGNPSAIGESAQSSGDVTPGARPVALAGVTDVADVGLASLRTCVALASGAVDCWGVDSVTPARVPDVGQASRLAVSDERACAVTPTGMHCWGDSAALGRGTTDVAFAGKPPAEIALSLFAGFAVTLDGSVHSWGSDRWMLGRQTPLEADWTPAPIDGLEGVAQIAASEQHACALTRDRRLFCWGRADHGALGLGSIRNVATPTEVLFADRIRPTQVAVSLTHSCARLEDGAVACWARSNASGELGMSALSGVYVPTRVRIEGSVSVVATGTSSTCALLVDGTVQCWGDNTYGQLGQSRRDDQRHTSPENVVFP